MRILDDLTQTKQARQFAQATVTDYGSPSYQQAGVGCTSKSSWSVAGRDQLRAEILQPTESVVEFHFPQRIPTTVPPVEVRVSGGRRQLQPHRNVQRLYRPQDQRGVQTVFVIEDRSNGQELARVRGGAAHCEIEAEKLARSQGYDFKDLIVRFEGEGSS